MKIGNGKPNGQNHLKMQGSEVGEGGGGSCCTQANVV